MLDPSHIAPSRSDANSNGHFPINPSANTLGTPRGFNLGSLSGLTPGFANLAGGMFPGFGNPVGLPPNWNPAGSDGAGAMRRNNRNTPNNRSGPYDRRQPRFNGNGRLSPRGGGTSSTPRGGDGGQGASGMGPTEATAGRALKSYQDLDAVAGGGSGELNY